MNEPIEELQLTVIEMSKALESLDFQLTALRQLVLANNNTLMEHVDQLRSLQSSPPSCLAEKVVVKFRYWSDGPASWNRVDVFYRPCATRLMVVLAVARWCLSERGPAKALQGGLTISLGCEADLPGVCGSTVCLQGDIKNFQEIFKFDVGCSDSAFKEATNSLHLVSVSQPFPN